MPITPEALAHIARYPDTCDAEVSRGGEAQPCDKPAVAIADHPEGPYPVCAYHTRAGSTVPLAAILAALR